MILSGLMALHIAAVFCWFGGAVAAEAALAGDLREFGVKELLRAGLPGLGAKALTGLLMVWMNPDYYLGQGWLIAKIVVALVPATATLVVFDSVRESKKARKRFYGSMMWLLAGTGAVILLLAFVRPF